MRLYEITGSIRDLLAGTDEDGELSDEMLTQLDALTGDMTAKVETICKIIREDESEVAARQAEIDRIKAGITTAENRKRRLKEYLQSCMTACGQPKIETDLFKCWIQASPPAATCVIDPVDLPDEFKRVKVEADSRAAIAAWKETGIAPPGFEVHQGSHLRIK